MPYHVRVSKLNTRFHKKYVIHTHDDPDAPPSSQPREEYWKSEKWPIGSGGQGRVFLQTCTSGSRSYATRAVKEIPLQEGSGRLRYIRELDAITRFSHERVCAHP